MRIDDNIRVPNEAPKAASSQLRVPPQEPDVTDVSKLAQAVASNQDARIEALRRSVESGTYEVSPAALASTLIDSHLKS